MSLASTIMLAVSMGGPSAPTAEETADPPAEEGAPAPAQPNFDEAKRVAPPQGPERDESQRVPPPQGPGRDDAATAVRLVWDAPATCSDAQSMQARLDEAMSLELEDDPAGRSRWVIARVREDDGQWSLRLWVSNDGELSERALSETNCEELERATLTIVAMLMPPVMVVPEPATPPPKPEDLEPKATSDPLDEEGLDKLIGDAEPAPEPPPDPGGPDMAPPPASKMRGAIGFAGGGGRGEMPIGGGMGRITAALVWPNARLEFQGNYAGSRSVGLALAPQARARYSFVSGAVRGCGAPSLSERIELSVCGGLEAGSVFANVDGATLLHGAGQPAVLLDFSAALHVVLVPTVALTFGAETWIATLKAQHRALEGDLPRTRRLGWRMLGGIEFRFGGRRKARAFERPGKETT